MMVLTDREFSVAKDDDDFNTVVVSKGAARAVKCAMNYDMHNMENADQTYQYQM